MLRLIDCTHAAAAQQPQHTIAAEIEGQKWRRDRYAPSSQADGRFAKLAGEAELEQAARAESLGFRCAERVIAFEAMGRRGRSGHRVGRSARSCKFPVDLLHE